MIKSGSVIDKFREVRAESEQPYDEDILESVSPAVTTYCADIISTQTEEGRKL